VKVTTEPHEVAFAPPQAADETVSEVVTIGPPQGDRTLSLDRPLTTVFDVTTVRVLGNVAHATHGQTVENEVIGSGDGSFGNPRFPLRQGPLTFVSSAEAAGRANTLQVQVNGVRWHEVERFNGLASDVRAYVVQQDAAGRTQVVFGDGRHGARLPSNREEVSATYRIGLGPAGNVAAGSLSQLMRGPAGIETVTNPLPAGGGTPPESVAEAKGNVGRRIRAPRRIVTLADYEKFARNFPGLGRVRAEWFRLSDGQVLHLTVADALGGPVLPASDLYVNLLRSLEDLRTAPTPQIQIASYRPVHFRVRVRLLIDPDYEARREAIAASVRRVVIERFSFPRREFAQPVSAAEVVGMTDGIEGVLAVRAVELSLPGADGSARMLHCQPARFTAGRILPAELLLLDPPVEDAVAIAMEVRA
jgi:predicted phage baseplate assembly protein